MKGSTTQLDHLNESSSSATQWSISTKCSENLGQRRKWTQPPVKTPSSGSLKDVSSIGSQSQTRDSGFPAPIEDNSASRNNSTGATTELEARIHLDIQYERPMNGIRNLVDDVPSSEEIRVDRDPNLDSQALLISQTEHEEIFLGDVLKS
eukprot:TRINITY_DN31141_c0_g1_i1.p1 TRINITY_DN31141_c0_g1~~TRINITY_DN31141_c0_g1_i1.p1  ORF type:complete len:150 (+),score=3.77 TRINITY_DN31141_c0_g1_i1:284-733(+)